jgi:GNAT superfamily N-acetyltransferase
LNALALRPAFEDDAPAIAQLRVDAWRATYRGVIPDAYLDAMNVEASTALWQRILSAAPNRTSTFVAEDTMGLVGFASALMLDPPKLEMDCELSAVYVRPGQQRAGVGRALVSATVAAQRDKGATGLVVWVIAANRGARAFYEALGGDLAVEQPFQWDGMDLIEAGYVWRDLDALAAACGDHAVVPH